MFSIDFIPGFVMGLREGLEAFLIIAIMLRYIQKLEKPEYNKDVYIGLGSGIVASIVFGVLLLSISNIIGASSDNIAKLWEFGASFIALVLITTFIWFMMHHGNKFTEEIQAKMDVNLSSKGIILVAFIMVVREGAEVVLFTFASADQGAYIVGAITGILTSAILAVLIYKSLIKVNLQLLFRVTLVYLILQAGFMLGYSIHELLSYLKATEIWDAGHPLYTKLFDLSGTILDHKEGWIGIPLYATIGWYSKPEIIQFILQYTYTVTFLLYYYRFQKQTTK